jgi:putative selenium metabolism hydrolase
LAQSYEADIVHFLRDLIAIPGESGHEAPVIARIRQEMEKVGFDEVRVDPMGNILGRIGSGQTVVMMDSHTDTVGVGDPREWAWDPYKGKVEDGYIYGRGSCDQRAGMASMVYAGKILKALDLAGDCTVYMVGSVQDAPGYLSRPSRAHGDGGPPARKIVPRQRPGARRQPHL